MRKPRNYWNKDRCHNLALKCQYRKQFELKYTGAYKSSVRNKWLDEVCSHMLYQGNKYKRLIYSREYTLYDDKFVYVGLTYNILEREKQHRKNREFNCLLDLGFKLKINKLSDYMDNDNAAILEGKFLNYYKNNEWTILNKSKTGSLGAIQKWTKSKCHNIALRYKTRKELRIEHNNVYSTIQRNGWVNELFSHMIELKKHRDYWTLDKCAEECKKYGSKFILYKNLPVVYEKIRKNKWEFLYNNSNVSVFNLNL